MRCPRPNVPWRSIRTGRGALRQGAIARGGGAARTKRTAEIETAVRLDPESWEVNREAARLIFRQGRIGDAIPYFEKAAALMESDWHNPSMLMTCYDAIGRCRADCAAPRKWTVERAEKAIAKDPTNSAVLAVGAAALAIIGEDRGRRNGSIAHCCSIPTNHHALQSGLRARQRSQGSGSRALKCWSRFLRTTLGRDPYPACRESIRDLDIPARRSPGFKDMLGSAKRAPGGIARLAESGGRLVLVLLALVDEQVELVLAAVGDQHLRRADEVARRLADRDEVDRCSCRRLPGHSI